MATDKKMVSVNNAVLVQGVQRFEALVPGQLTNEGVVIPGPHLRRADRQAGTRLHCVQVVFRQVALLALEDLGQRTADRLGQQREVLLEHVVDSALAHHRHRVLFTKYPREKNERRVRGVAPGQLQHLRPR